MEQMKEFIIEQKSGETVVVQIIRSNRRSLGLQVKADGSVFARVPKLVTDQTVVEFIRGHENWILKKLELVCSKDNRPDIVYLPEVTRESDKERIRTFIEEKVAHYAEVMGVTYGKITMRNQKTRWGSCSDEGNLNFNCRLLFVPDRIVDYVVIHELAHRRFMNHSKSFWHEVEKYMPDYKEQRKMLARFAIKC